MNHPAHDKLKQAYEAGWMAAAGWAKRLDLLADMGSGAYRKEQDAAISSIAPGQPEVAEAPLSEAAASKIFAEFAGKNDFGVPYLRTYAQGFTFIVRAIEKAQMLAQGCHRSHPHEDMNEACKLKTEIARLNNENARLRNQATGKDCLQVQLPDTCFQGLPTHAAVAGKESGNEPPRDLLYATVKMQEREAERVDRVVAGLEEIRAAAEIGKAASKKGGE